MISIGFTHIFDTLNWAWHCLKYNMKLIHISISMLLNACCLWLDFGYSSPIHTQKCLFVSFTINHFIDWSNPEVFRIGLKINLNFPLHKCVAKLDKRETRCLAVVRTLCKPVVCVYIRKSIIEFQSILFIYLNITVNHLTKPHTILWQIHMWQSQKLNICKLQPICKSTHQYFIFDGFDQFSKLLMKLAKNAIFYKAKQ